MELEQKMLTAVGLPVEERAKLAELIEIFNEHKPANEIKRKYYEGHISLSSVNLGLALPRDLRGLEIGCAWGEKAVDVLAARSMFDGFVGRNGADAETMTEICRANRLVAEYAKACRDQLKYGCTFATLSRDDATGCRIRFHSPETAAAVWDGTRGRIGCGLAIIDSAKDDAKKENWRPAVVNLYTDDAVWVLIRNGEEWAAVEYANKMGRPLMEPLVWNATSAKPFGRSRLKYSVRKLIDGYIRTVANASIGLEFATSPQKYLLGVSDDQYDTITGDKFQSYVGAVIAATANPETGEKPTFGQLSQGTLEPHVQQLRMLATQFGAATGLSAVDVGVINDANPSSADAINAADKSLVLMAEQLNISNGDALYNIALMAQAIAGDKTLDELTAEEREIMAHFKNPATPSVSATADAAVKIATARPGFAETDVYMEMLGFSPADIRRIKAQESRARGLLTLQQIEGNNNA